MKREETYAVGNESMYATEIIKTILGIVQGTKERYSRQFLTELLTGNERIIRRPEYQKLAGYGALRMEEQKLESFFRLMVKQGYLIVKDKYFGILKITDFGKEFLKEPTEEYFDSQELCAHRLYTYMDALLEVRNEIAQQANCKSFEVCPEYILEQLAIEKPANREALAQITTIRVDLNLQYWDAFIQKIQKLNQIYRESPPKNLNGFDSLPALKELIEAGKSIEEIALDLNIDLYQAKKLVEQLCLAKELNLRSWIEKQVSSDVLQQVVAFFKISKEKSLKTAKEFLDVDYKILRYGRMYACLT